MSVQLMSPLVRSRDEVSVPVVPNGRSPRPLGWLVIAFAVVPLFLLLVDDQPGSRLLMGALTVTIIVVGVGLLASFGAIEAGVVRVDRDAATLRFVPPRAATLPRTATAIALLLPAIAQGVADAAGLPTGLTTAVLSRAPYLLGALGVVVLAVRLWQLRVPTGLELTPTGLRGIRGVADIDLRWDDLADVGVVAAPAAKLTLVTRGGGGGVLAPALALGSDPNQVAAIVRYYLDRPAERGALEEGGVAAVRRVEQGAQR